MEQDEHMVLQQGVGPPAAHVEVGRGEPLAEGVGGAEGEEEEEGSDDEHDHRRPGDEGVVEAGPITADDDGGVDGQEEQPQQDAALQRAPQGGEVEQRGGVGGAHLLHIGDAPVACDQGPLHDDHRHHRTGEGDPHVGLDRAHQAAIAQHGGGGERPRTERRGGEPDDQRRVAEKAVQSFCEHAAASSSA